MWFREVFLTYLLLVQQSNGQQTECRSPEIRHGQILIPAGMMMTELCQYPDPGKKWAKWSVAIRYVGELTMHADEGAKRPGSNT